MFITLTKILSENDIGATGSHQAGILIPKTGGYLDAFPMLDSYAKNPRCELSMSDEFGKSWVFTFIYYNGKKFGGTRDEYRLTGMTRYLRERGAAAGDSLSIEKDDSAQYKVWIVSERGARLSDTPEMATRATNQSPRQKFFSGSKILELNLSREIVPRRTWTIKLRK